MRLSSSRPLVERPDGRDYRGAAAAAQNRRNQERRRRAQPHPAAHELDAKILSRPMKMGSTVQRLPEFTRKVKPGTSAR
ncbi:hypothetical protein [Methylibium sp.]|uniref:hypothetical protein n=1 Tax=Methylibium sp. TaxID=2067992 RepID=UPI003D13F75F